MAQGKKTKKKKKLKIKKYKPYLLLAGGVIASPSIILTTFWLLFLGKIYPGVYIAGYAVGAKTPQEVITLLENQVTPPQKLTLNYENTQKQEFDLPLETLDFKYDWTKTADAAYRLTRTGNPLFNFRTTLSTLIKKQDIGFRFTINHQKLDEFLWDVAGNLAVEPIYPSAKIFNHKIVIEPGEKGTQVNQQALELAIGQALAYNQTAPIKIEVEEVDPSLTPEETRAFSSRAEKYLDKSIKITFEFEEFVYDDSDLISLLDPKGDYNQEKVNELVYQVARDINREPQNAKFEFENGRVKEFAAAKDGIALKTEELNNQIIQSLESLQNTDEELLSLTAPVEKTPPKVATAEVNDLGIKELIGRGTSRFRGSISSRVHNIALAASRINGTLIPPGTVASFNQMVGEVDKLTGYREAYIIKDGQTILGDGGGVCQVSTTFFRAALDAGLPIIERRAHAYRVGYYEQDRPVGFDATVYAPTTDLKIKNDTPTHILVQAYTDTKNMTLTFEFYGTSDGRTATTTRPIVTDVTEPPEDLYIDDPNLPAGEIKQIDYKAWGAKSRFTYTVTRDSETIYQKTFYSTYRPWQAKFLRGTGPATP